MNKHAGIYLLVYYTNIFQSRCIPGTVLEIQELMGPMLSLQRTDCPVGEVDIYTDQENTEGQSDNKNMVCACVLSHI